MEQKVNQRVRITKMLIEQAFVECLKEKEIHKISIRELCEKAGINHCTFYRYYGSQYDVLAEMENNLLTAVSEAITADDKSQPLETLFCYLEKNAEMCKFLVNNNIDQSFPEKLFSLPVIQNQISDAISKTPGKEHMEYFSNFLFYGVFRIVQIWINKQDRESPKEIIKLILSIIDKSVTTD